MRMNRSNRNWTLIGLLGLAGVSSFIGCSSETAPPAPLPNTTSGTGGTTPTAGTGGAAGTTYMPTSGTGGTTPTAGTGGTGGAVGGTGGTAGTTAGTNSGGTGGTPIVVLDCDAATSTKTALPISLDSKWGFPDSDLDSFSEFAFDGECEERAPGTSVGTCKKMTFKAGAKLYAGWFWHNTAGNWGGSGVCVADGAIAVRFQAKSTLEGATGTVGAAGVEIPLVLSTEWQTFEIDISGVADVNKVNAAGGVNTGLYLYLTRAAADVGVARTIYIDNIEWTADPAGGEGGAGAGGASAGGAGGAG